VLPTVDVSGLSFFVHAPYVMNVASSNNKIRIPSRKILENHAKAAAQLGARGLVVHGGHVTAGEDPALGIANWVKALERIELPLPLLLENTAGGDFAMARRLDAIARLWDAIGGFDDVGLAVGPLGHRVGLVDVRTDLLHGRQPTMTR
jgi:deoxyribonuclease-4